MNVLVFAGTTEGRLLAERLGEAPLRATFCVATEYGAELLAGLSERSRVRVGRMDADAMRDFMSGGSFACVIDATHPYAVAASENIRMAAAAAGIPCYRLSRGESEAGNCVRVDSISDAVRVLAAEPGNALITTGSKNLAEYVAMPDFAERLYPRVLPTVEAIRACEDLGFRRSHVIAMQGPFGRELNLAIMRRFAIAILVTKDGGDEGGLPDKLAAADEAGVRVVLVGRPAAGDGDDLETVVARTLELAGRTS